jgi:hypothetical protein
VEGIATKVALLPEEKTLISIVVVKEYFGKIYTCILGPKIIFLKSRLIHFREKAKSRLIVEKTHYCSPEMYTSC